MLDFGYVEMHTDASFSNHLQRSTHPNFRDLLFCSVMIDIRATPIAREIVAHKLYQQKNSGPPVAETLSKSRWDSYTPVK